jgi:TonB family protein
MEMMSTPKVATIGWIVLLFAISCQRSPRQVATVNAVAPTYPILAALSNTFGDADVAVTIDKSGSVSSAAFQRGNPLFKAAVLDAANRWKFQPGASSHDVTLRFSFRLMPKGSVDADVTAVFVPPYQIEVRQRHPDEGVNY